MKNSAVMAYVVLVTFFVLRAGCAASESSTITPNNSTQTTIQKSTNVKNSTISPSVITQFELAHNESAFTLTRISAMLSENKPIVQNMMFALIGLTSLVVLYFIIRTIRLRQKKSKSRKYGVLTSGMEMDHLESDSDDEDTTVFEINRR
jgi:hypothetical protein